MPTDNLIPSEDAIHQLYSDAQRYKEEKDLRTFRQIQALDNPTPLTGRQGYYSNPARFSRPSFRSAYFNIGEGLKVIAPNTTVVLARKTVPQLHGGVLTGFSQDFTGCDPVSEYVHQVTWGLRINDLPTAGFNDFVGEFSSLALPHSVYFPLAAGAATLGMSSVSPGGAPFIDPMEETPTIYFQATNHAKTSIVLQARLIGYTFPLAERADEFQSP